MCLQIPEEAQMVSGTLWLMGSDNGRAQEGVQQISPCFRCSFPGIFHSNAMTEGDPTQFVLISLS